MRVIYFQKKFICECSFSEREIPKAAKFKWHERAKIWFTESPQVAHKLKKYCDEEALKKLSRFYISNIPFEKELIFPKDLSLFPFQKEAIRFALARNRCYLGLDPGLGKTICAAVICETLKECEITYVCPPFLTETVRTEFEKWTTRNPSIIPDSQLSRFSHLKGGILIVDEAHRFKNHSALRSQYLFEDLVPNFEKVVFMSGTPMPNYPMELFMVLYHGAPETIDFKDMFEFGRYFCNGHKNHWGWDFSGSSHFDELREKVIPKFMLRIRKKDVLKELSPKMEGMVFLTDSHTKTVEKLDRELLEFWSPEDLLNTVNEHIASYRKAIGEMKVKSASTFIESILDETNESVLVFAVHKTVIAELSKSLSDFSPIVITGDTEMSKRHLLVEEFQLNPKKRLFIGNIQAAGTGFTLTKATRVVFVEYSWTPSDNIQAADRAHRVNQRENVLVHYLVYRHSIDAKVLQTNLDKLKLIERL
jgi:SWI/SNF-related matrix-associated actin-dependent regulator of chromatin subfamily A-like protein 1